MDLDDKKTRNKQYHFRIDYYHNKANRATNALSQYPQRNAEKEETFQAENTKILYQLQSSLVQVSELNVLDMSVSGLRRVPSPLYQVFICGTAVLS